MPHRRKETKWRVPWARQECDPYTHSTVLLMCSGARRSTSPTPSTGRYGSSVASQSGRSGTPL